VKHRDAGREDFKELAGEISEETGLPMGLDHYFRYLVLLNKASDPLVMAANHYYGKLRDGSMFYRGIETRRHDTPPFIHETQEQMIHALFKPTEPENVLDEGLSEAQSVARQAIRELKQGRVDPRELVISKRLLRDLDGYRSKQPHIVAALLGDMEEMSRYILVNTEQDNPFLRVMPESMIDDGHRAYDRRKYASMMRRAAWNILRPFVPDESMIVGSRVRETLLDRYLH
jgi:DNA polymerase elongation subunit (family B)